MKAAVFYGPRDIRIDNVPAPHIQNPKDAIVKVKYACICGSDLWSYRGLSPREKGSRIGHEFIGIVEDVGRGVTKIKKGDFVIAAFSRSDGTCPECKMGMPSSCRNGGYWGVDGYDGGQGEMVRVPNADHMLIVVPKNKIKEKLMKAFTALTDVMCTGHHAAICASVSKEKTVAVVGDGAVGLCAVLASRRLGAKQIILLSSHNDRAKIGQKFGATNIIAARDDEAFKKVRKLTNDTGVDCVLECVGTKDSWETAFKIVRKGGRIGWVGIPHDVAPINLANMFSENIGIMGGRAPSAVYIPQLLPEVLFGKLDPSPVFTKTISLSQIKDGYEAMDKRKAIKVLIKF
ncbi:MAG: IMP dehydrogenase [Candidatus Levybacteria bacterium RIFCSPHIGHO2_02_FULL_37_13]|nr:MAG: IMP dehydrogenase [Candidatus Levybacteria bacterium RIFCSPHIGHO2_02_FULL_37_13]OGH40376.1 MAG: IMP dehydrogenase [Candidatus Levybacteria bacterium RIFCSPLOWO2_01_FULL_37_26]